MAYVPTKSSQEWGTLGEEATPSSSSPSRCQQIEQCSNNDDKKWWEGLSAEEYTSVDIAIIGAGHAGLATAIGLLSRFHHQNHHDRNRNRDSSLLPPYKIRIYERDPELRKTSQGMLIIRPTGKAYLGRIHPDLPKLVSEAGCPFHKVIHATVNKDGGDSGTGAGSETIIREGGGIPDATLIRWHALRSTLERVLRDVLLENDETMDDILMTDHSLVTYKEVDAAKGMGTGTLERDSDDGVFLLFENGNIVRAQIVIGADGTFSSVRRTMNLSDEDRPVYFGQMNWNAIVPTDTLEKDARPPKDGIKVITYSGETRNEEDDSNDDADPIPRWGVYINDTGANHTFFQLRVTDMKKARALSGSKGRGGLGLPGVKAALLPIVSLSPHVTNVWNALPESMIFERAIIGRLPARTWLSPGGRVALLGDAAHGMHPQLGEGCNQALGSATSLVEAITLAYKNNSSNHGACSEKQTVGNTLTEILMKGLESYDQSRRPRMDWLLRFANLCGCAQSSSEGDVLDPKAIASWRKWLATTDNQIQPPDEGRDIVYSFDPLSLTEVSLV